MGAGGLSPLPPHFNHWEWEVNQQQGREEFKCHTIWQTMVLTMLHSNGQLLEDREGWIHRERKDVRNLRNLTALLSISRTVINSEQVLLERLRPLTLLDSRSAVMMQKVRFGDARYSAEIDICKFSRRSRIHRQHRKLKIQHNRKTLIATSTNAESPSCKISAWSALDHLHDYRQYCTRRYHALTLFVGHQNALLDCKNLFGQTGEN